MSEIPVRPRPRRLADWINPTGAKKVHSLVDKVYKRKNLEIAWERVQANRGSGGVDGQSLEEFSTQVDRQLGRLQSELQEGTYQPQPVTTQDLIDELNPKLRGWGHYYQRAQVRKLFTRLDAWIVRRIWSHRCKRWRCSGWKQLPQTTLYGELGLVSLVTLHLRARPPGRESS